LCTPKIPNSATFLLLTAGVTDRRLSDCLAWSAGAFLMGSRTVAARMLGCHADESDAILAMAPAARCAQPTVSLVTETGRVTIENLLYSTTFRP
jgi:hypothetical protein